MLRTRPAPGNGPAAGSVLPATFGEDGTADRRGAAGPIVVAAIAGARAVVAAASGFILTGGLAVLVWAVTPSSGAGPVPLLRAGLAAFAAAHGMRIQLGATALTIPPMLLTLVAVALLSAVTGRGRVAAVGLSEQLVGALVATGVYGAAVTTTGVLLAAPGAVSAGDWWRPALVAAVTVGPATLIRAGAAAAIDQGAHRLWPVLGWLPTAFRISAVGAAGVLGAGGLVLAVGLGGSFTRSASLLASGAPGPAGGFGMTLLGLAFLPNAVVGAAGYLTGAGFTIGQGSYSVFGSFPAPLPPIPLLTAVPDHLGRAPVGLLLLLLPIGLGIRCGRLALRSLTGGGERILAAGLGGVLAGLMLGLVAATASGGVAGGSWPTSGAPPMLFAGLAAAELGGSGAAVAGLAGLFTLVRGRAAGRAARSQLAGRSRPDEADAVQDGSGLDQGSTVPEVMADGEPVDADPVDDQTVEADPIAGQIVEADPPDSHAVDVESHAVDPVHGQPTEDQSVEVDQVEDGPVETGSRAAAPSDAPAQGVARVRDEDALVEPEGDEQLAKSLQPTAPRKVS